MFACVAGFNRRKLHRELALLSGLLPLGVCGTWKYGMYCVCVWGR